MLNIPSPNTSASKHIEVINKLRRLSLMICLVGFNACGGGGGGGSNPVTPPGGGGGTPTPPTGLLVNDKTPTQLASYVGTAFARQVNTVAEKAGTTTAESAADGATSDSGATYSVTYTAEASVDEHDAVKYDGELLFVAPSRNANCCWIFSDDAGPGGVSETVISQPAVAEEPPAIRILRTDPTTTSVTAVSEIALPEGTSVEGLYRTADRVLALTTTNWWGAWGSNTDIARWSGEQVGLLIFDTSEPENPQQAQTITIEGGLITSRRTTAGVHLVSRHTPTIEGLTYYPETQAEADANKAILDVLEWDDLLPKVSVGGVATEVFAANSCYSVDSEHPLAPTAAGYPSITAVITVNPTTGAIADALCYLEYSDGAYFAGAGSEDAANVLYLTQTEYDADSGYNLLVHRFALGSNLAYTGSGKVDGYLFLSGQSDFRISADGNYLRLVTTTNTGDADDRFDHNLYVLQQSADAPELNIVGQLPNSTRTEELGKPNEDLYGVRFIGKRAFLVTFERTDPLYTIDLSDPADPFVAGALEVTGFSNFLHPINDDLLLGLGQSENNHTKLELFDVSDFDNPVSRAALDFADDMAWNYSEAEYNRHAFTYLAGATSDRFAIPIYGTIIKDGTQKEVHRLQLLQVDGKDSAATATLRDMGYLSVSNLPEGEYASGLNRSVIDNDAIYFINGTRVFAAGWNDPFNQTGPH